MLILVYVGLFVLIPWTLGVLLGLLWRRPVLPTWISGALPPTLTLLGWSLAWLLGHLGWLAYEASILLCSGLFGPGLFFWGLRLPATLKS